MCIFVYQTTIPRHANCCQDVVTSHHDGANVGLSQLPQNSFRGRLELILKDDEPYEIQVILDILAFHLLRLNPWKFCDVSSSACDDPVTLVGVIG